MLKVEANHTLHNIQKFFDFSKLFTVRAVRILDVKYMADTIQT
jgi:hypothetical protein